MEIINNKNKELDNFINCIYLEWNLKENIADIKNIYIEKIKNNNILIYKYYNYGFFSILFENDYIFISDFFIYPLLRRKGHGTNMLKDAVKISNLFSTNIFLKCKKHNLNFYLKNKFYIFENPHNDSNYKLKYKDNILFSMFNSFFFNIFRNFFY